MTMTNDGAHSGRDLHREFVGMLFALAIAEVAVQASSVVNSGLELAMTLPSYAHLSLAAIVIIASWVGWGQSAYSLSNIRSLFTRDFIELATDLWLVALYFFVARGVELPTEVSGQSVITPSLSNETSLLWLVFVTYFIWDVFTKNGRQQDGHYVLVQRGWASGVCAAIASVFVCVFPTRSSEAPRVIFGDCALLALVFLFRAMKLEDLRDLSGRNWALICSVFLFLVMTAEGAVQLTGVGRLLSSWMTILIA